jgi:hypothetical protein
MDSREQKWQKFQSSWCRESLVKKLLILFGLLMLASLTFFFVLMAMINLILVLSLLSILFFVFRFPNLKSFCWVRF